jgi:hypothetical protein
MDMRWKPTTRIGFGYMQKSGRLMNSRRSHRMPNELNEPIDGSQQMISGNVPF